MCRPLNPIQYIAAMHNICVFLLDINTWSVIVFGTDYKYGGGNHHHSMHGTGESIYKSV